MRICLIDVDGHNFPNLPLMKLSAWHKKQGDTVEWYEPLFHSLAKPFDKAYMSKVFSFTPDYPCYVNAKEVHKGEAVTLSGLWMEKKFMTKKKTMTCHQRSKQSIQIMRFIMTGYQKSGIPLTVF